jgi:hypothetical protein
MTYPEQIAAADTHGRAAPRYTGGQGIDHIITVPAQDRLLAALEREQARWTVRRMANRHGCRTGRCRRPEHAQDLAAMVEVWDALGLGEVP